MSSTAAGNLTKTDTPSSQRTPERTFVLLLVPNTDWVVPLTTAAHTTGVKVNCQTLSKPLKCVIVQQQDRIPDGRNLFCKIVRSSNKEVKKGGTVADCGQTEPYGGRERARSVRQEGKKDRWKRTMERMSKRKGISVYMWCFLGLPLELILFISVVENNVFLALGVFAQLKEKNAWPVCRAQTSQKDFSPLKPFHNE